MEHYAGGHLTGSEIEIVGRGSNAPDQASYGALVAHLGQCAACRARLELYRGHEEGRRYLKAEPGAPIPETCPDQEKWISLAGGLVGESESASLLDHAASCDACGTYLKEAVEDLNAVDIPPEATPALSRQVRDRVAAQLRSQFTPQCESATVIRTQPRRLIPVWAYIGMAAIGLIAIVTVPSVFRPDPSRLLVQAYEHGRAGPVRFPGAAFTPEAGVVRSAGARSAVLAEAEAEILRALEKAPNDPKWLRLRGQSDFLRRRYDSAIAAIQPLAQAQNATADVYMDLGMIYLARGLAETNPSDYEHAVEYLSRGLQKEPDHPAGLFNRALALEALFLWDRAEEDWNNYLRIDGASGWAREARERLERVREKKTRGAGA